MVHRVFRLSISPERAPDVVRVVDFDGRASLHDVHATIQTEMKLDNDHLYAFYLSGNYFDRSSEYGISDDSKDSGRALLFRLGLREGQQIAYLFDFGDELRHTVTVAAIRDVEAPLPEPVLVQSVGEPPPQYLSYDEEEDEPEPQEVPEHLAEVAPLAEAVLSLSERLDVLYEEDDAKHAPPDGELAEDEEQGGPPEPIVSVLRELAKAALELAGALEEDAEAVFDLDEWSAERELLPRLVELPLGLVNAGELDSALAVARAFAFVAPEPFKGDVAIILAEAGKRDEAVAQLAANLAEFPESFLTAMKAGEAYEALGDPVAAEASYRRAITLGRDPREREEASAQLVGFLDDAGRSDEADALIEPPQPPSAAVGRNDPCPCGSGKKYKKCHGA
jgi:hypothetical protein